MKANKAPKRIWINLVNDLPKLNGYIDKDSVEYIRKDTFIEKACKWLTNAFHQNSNGTFNYVGGNECTIKDIVCIFKQGMEE